jgi:hypothetical protein
LGFNAILAGFKLAYAPPALRPAPRPTLSSGGGGFFIFMFSFNALG